MGDLTSQFLHAILPKQKDGWLTGNVGIGGHYNSGNSYEFTSFPPFAYQWPAQEAEAVAHIQRHADADVFTCPYLQKTPQRHKGNATYRDIVHCDCDKSVDLDKVRQVHGVPLWSGSPGHAHVYVRLTHCVTPAQHEALERGLVAFLDGDKAKINDNDLLRPAGARNHKGQQPAWVVPAIDYASVIPIDPFELAGILGIDINAAPSDLATGSAPSSTDREPVDLSAYPRIDEESNIYTVPPDRSKDTYRIACVVRDAQLTLAHFRWVIDQRPDLAGRAGSRRDDDVLRAWERAQNEWQARMAAAAQGLGQQQPPGAPPTPVNPAAFFSRTGGLLVGVLARAVMSTVTCGYGFSRFYTYRDGVWTPGEEPIEAEIVRLLGDRFRTSHLTNVCAVIKYTPGITGITDDPLAEFINVPNGMVAWRSGDILPHDPIYRSTIQLPVEYVPNADCPLFEKFLREVLPADLIDSGFIWELIGYCLYSGNPIQVAVLLHGAGRNGKGVLIRVLKALLGAHNCSSVSLYELIENKFRVAELLGKLANLAGDIDAKWLENTAMFKKITGEDSVTAEEKYRKPFDFTPWALPFYSTNKPFGSTDSSEGWMDRWVVVPFPNSFSGHEDRRLTEKLTSEGELRGILVRAVAALPTLMNRERFADLRPLQEAKTEFMIASDSVRAWVFEDCDIDVNAWIPRKQLHQAYRLHSLGEGIANPLGPREFYNRIGQMGGIANAGRNGVRGFSGIKLKGVSANVSS